MLFTSFDHSSHSVKLVRQRSLAKCLAHLSTPHENNMQQMVTKCCVLLGEKFGSFDWALWYGFDYTKHKSGDDTTNYNVIEGTSLELRGNNLHTR